MTIPDTEVRVDVVRYADDPFRSGRVRLRYGQTIMTTRSFIHREDAEEHAARLRSRLTDREPDGWITEAMRDRLRERGWTGGRIWREEPRHEGYVPFVLRDPDREGV